MKSPSTTTFPSARGAQRILESRTPAARGGGKASLAPWVLAGALLAAIGAGPVRAAAYEDFNRAIATDDAPAVSRLLGRGMDPNTVNERGEPALLSAARESGPDVVRALLKARAKVNVRNQFGDTPIMVASLRGHLAIVKLLREAGADINHPGWTPLLYAALNGHNAVIEYLLSTGADVGLTAPNGATPLMLAVLGKKPETVKLLASYGFDVNARNEKGETALAWAKRDRNEEMELVLRSVGARQ